MRASFGASIVVLRCWAFTFRSPRNCAPRIRSTQSTKVVVTEGMVLHATCDSIGANHEDVSREKAHMKKVCNLDWNAAIGEG